MLLNNKVDTERPKKAKKQKQKMYPNEHFIKTFKI